MDHLDGESVRQTLSRVKRLKPSRALHIAYQTLAGVMQMHEHGIVHCDLKPDNLILCVDGHAYLVVKIIDFGVIVLLASPPPPGFRGTYVYASPEQLQGAVPTPKCDVWAVGMILYELLTGVRPFAEYGDGREGAMTRVGKTVRSLRDFGLDEPHLDAFFARALNPDLTARFESAFEMWRAVGTIRKLYEGKDGTPNEVTTDNRQHVPVVEPPRHITAAELAGPTHPDAQPLAWDRPIPFDPAVSSAETRNERGRPVSTDPDPPAEAISAPSDRATRSEDRRKAPTALPSEPRPTAKPIGPPPSYVEPPPLKAKPVARASSEVAVPPMDAPKTLDSGPPNFEDLPPVVRAVLGGPRPPHRPRPMHEREGVEFVSRWDRFQAWRTRRSMAFHMAIGAVLAILLLAVLFALGRL